MSYNNYIYRKIKSANILLEMLKSIKNIENNLKSLEDNKINILKDIEEQNSKNVEKLKRNLEIINDKYKIENDKLINKKENYSKDLIMLKNNYNITFSEKLLSLIKNTSEGNNNLVINRKLNKVPLQNNLNQKREYHSSSKIMMSKNNTTMTQIF